MDWYLVRTRKNKEGWVRDQLKAHAREIFLPLLAARTIFRSQTQRSTMPLFPCYLFAQIDLLAHYFHVKYMAGVAGLVSAGNEPLTVPECIIESIKQRCVEGVFTLAERPFQRNERLSLTDRRFNGLEAIFDRYTSGKDRVVILLNTVNANGVRMNLPASKVTRLS